MNAPGLLALLFALSSFGVATLVGWFVAMAGFSIIKRLELTPRTRAVCLAQARLLPLLLAVSLVATQQWAFWSYEVGGREVAGPLLLSLAGCGAILLADAVSRALRSIRATRVVVGSWRVSATPMTMPRWTRRAWAIQRRFPVVAVVGVFRPQLFVARQVASTCTPSELAAIAAHESAHVAARDNLIRLLFPLTPGAPAFPGAAAEMEAAWLVAAEEAADASAQQSSSAVDLASALTKVARLAANSSPEAMPTSALIRGRDLESRVQRLLESPSAAATTPLAWLPSLVFVAGVVAISATPLLHRLHQLFELLVRRY